MTFIEFVSAHPRWTFVYLVVVMVGLVGIAEAFGRRRK